MAVNLTQLIEAMLFASDKPLTVDQLMTMFVEDFTPPQRDEIKAALKELTAAYANRAVNLVEVASGYRFQVRDEFAPWVGRLTEERPQRYSRAMLETLAIIAYRQPITRGDIEDIRGVAVSSQIMKTLQEREWVRVVGHKDVPGRPALFATTRQFLDYFNLKTLDQLPPLAEVRSLEEIGRALELDLQANAADASETMEADPPSSDATLH
ncbi:SMC-Scp complex subunit ScpB [Hahella aquimaris]|uniref:SMC-Scp complex subunit ScpB n=1 Tax=Hahella sp. HNIBRBA332 TaxID=3015983 RepID=UPI00273BBE3C|nr:SMC-Scp complex subunit ScpB [Hahella sp. HNIBRBA332]WLQ15098.1 SMC-Scp complex subunit ScpB [Hahella sp. HNIBRBA332]